MAIAEILSALHLKIGKKAKISTHSYHTFNQYCINDSFNWYNEARRKHKGWKGRSKAVFICRKQLFTWNDLRNTKERHNYITKSQNTGQYTEYIYSYTSSK